MRIAALFKNARIAKGGALAAWLALLALLTIVSMAHAQQPRATLGLALGSRQEGPDDSRARI